VDFLKIAIAADHGGFALKQELKNYLKALKTEDGSRIELIDLGTNSAEAVDYPDYALQVAKAVASGKAEKGILVCGTGIGMGMAANKIRGVRAAVCWNEETSKLSREHNDANVLCLGGRVISVEQAKKIVLVWLKTPFSAEERHARRIWKIGGMK